MQCKKILLVSTLWFSVIGWSAANVLLEEVETVDSSNQAGWWVPLALHDGETFFSFNATGSLSSKHKVKVAKRSADGLWEAGFLKNSDGSLWEHSDDNGHDQPTIAVDGDGTIHVFADHHNDDWRYFRSSSPADVSNIIGRSDITQQSGIYTYPVATTAPNGDIYLIVRDTNGSDVGKGQLFHWDNNTDTWSHVATFASQTNTRVYPDDVVVDNNGDVHIIWEWAYGHPRADRHYGSYLKYEPNSGLFRNIKGSVVAPPVNLSTPDLFYQGLEQGESFTSSNTGKGIQSAKLALGNTGRPSVVFRFRTDNASNGSRDYEIFRIRWNGSQWVDKTSLYSSQNTIAALGHTIVNDRVRAYFVNNNKQLLVAEKTAGGSWSTHVLSKDESIERINVKVKNNVEDIVYGSAPTSQTSQSGQLFYLSVGHDLSNLPAPVNPVTFEAEALSYSSSGTVTNIIDSNASAGEYLMLQDNSVNDWIEFVLPNLEVGTYSLSMSYKTHSSRGITQLAYEGQHVGTAVDQYSTGISWPIATIGSFTVNSPGDKLLRLTVTGKHPNSTGYRISIDKIILK